MIHSKKLRDCIAERILILRGPFELSESRELPQKLSLSLSVIAMEIVL